MADGLERAREQGDPRTTTRGGDRGLGPGVPSPDHEDIEVMRVLGHADNLLQRSLRPTPAPPPMPLKLTTSAPTLLIKREAFERAQLTREGIDRWLNLTPEEFRVEGALVAIGPVYDEDGLQALVVALEEKGLVYFDEFFEMSGNWPEWLALWATADAGSGPF